MSDTPGVHPIVRFYIIMFSVGVLGAMLNISLWILTPVAFILSVYGYIILHKQGDI